MPKKPRLLKKPKSIKTKISQNKLERTVLSLDKEVKSLKGLLNILSTTIYTMDNDHYFFKEGTGLLNSVQISAFKKFSKTKVYLETVRRLKGNLENSQEDKTTKEVKKDDAKDNL